MDVGRVHAGVHRPRTVVGGDHAVALLHLDRNARRQEDVHARAELHHADALADHQRVALAHARHDAARQQADDLAVDGGAAVVVDPHFRLLVHRAALRLVGRQELPGLVRDLA